MLRRSSLLFGFTLLTIFTPFRLSAQSLVVFGGYSWLRPPVTVTETGCPVSNITCTTAPPTINVTNRQNLNGFEITATYRFLPFLGLAADYSGHYGSAISHSSSNVHQQSYLFGPEVSFPASVSPFAHVLLGGAHQSISSSTLSGNSVYTSIASSSDSGFATVVGAGIDLKFLPHIAIRPIQLDYMVTKLHGNTQNQPRFSAGIVLHF